MRTNHIRVVALTALCVLFVLPATSFGQNTPTSNPVPTTWGAVKAMYDINDKADAQNVGGVNRYDSFPSAWKFPFH